MRANGGIWFGQATSDFTPTIGASVFISTSTGANLTTAGVWTDMSDKNAKTNFAPVNDRAVLAQLIDLPIATWNYKVEDPAIRHIGPTAQDFYNTFNVGNNDAHLAALGILRVTKAPRRNTHSVGPADETCSIMSLR